MNRRMVARSFQLALTLLTVFVMVVPTQGSVRARLAPPAGMPTQHSLRSRMLGSEVRSQDASLATVSSAVSRHGGLSNPPHSAGSPDQAEASSDVPIVPDWASVRQRINAAGDPPPTLNSRTPPEGFTPSSLPRIRQSMSSVAQVALFKGTCLAFIHSAVTLT